MSNRYYSQFSDRKITAPTPPKDSRGGSNPPYPEKTFPWTKDIGDSGPKRNTIGVREVKAYAAQKLADDKGLSRHKAKKMLHEGEANDKPLTKKQRGLFGAIASGKSRRY